jgi:hypothetical protein
MPKSTHTKKLIFNEKYHDNCHDYLKSIYLEKYAVPKYKPLLYEIQKKIPIVNICHDLTPYDYANIIVCDQHGVVFSHSEDIYPILATYALNACVGLVMYVPKFRVGSVAHFDGLPGYSMKSANADNVPIDFDPVQTNIRIILRVIRNISQIIYYRTMTGPLFQEGVEVIDIDYYLIGGIFDLSEIMIHDIIECIVQIPSNRYHFTFRGRNILGPENQSRNICLDTCTGKITYFDYITNSEFYANYRNTNGLPINIITAPRKSEAVLDITYRPHFAT